MSDPDPPPPISIDAPRRDWRSIRAERDAAKTAWKHETDPLATHRIHWAVAGTSDSQTSAPPAPRKGIGLSLAGGGIRSATLSLGVIQALARAGEFERVDYLSTVSGGTYVGTFLRSLFLPYALRGTRPGAAPDDAEIERQHRFAMRALTSEPDETTIPGPAVGSPPVRNPIRWLREHGRYLAPNGPTDYFYAAAYMVRNWLAMLYTFSMAMLALLLPIATFLALLQWALRGPIATCMENFEAGTPAACMSRGVTDGPTWISPIFLLTALIAYSAICLGAAYWLTKEMSTNEPDPRRQRARFWRTFIPSVCTVAIGIAYCLHYVGIGLPSLPDEPTPSLLALSVVTALTAIGAGASAFALRWYAVTPSDSLLTAELRRQMTNALGARLRWILALLVLGVIDTVAALLRNWFWSPRPTLGHLAAGVVPPVVAFIVQRLSTVFGGSASSGRVGQFMARLLPAIALLAGVLLFGGLAVVADAFLQAAMWQGHAWKTGDIDWPSVLPFVATAGLLVSLTGMADGFVNLSSLHTYYASRLTRAYLGATNADRLARAADPDRRDVYITENHPKDYIDPWAYGWAALPAPMHLINTTLNETIDPGSQIVERDRKGVILTVGPEGVRIGLTEAYPWSATQPAPAGSDIASGAERLSIGQWCAISGAAASAGMGQITKLGYALVLSFGNVRLGYWWKAPGLRPAAATATWGRIGALMRDGTDLFMRLAGTYVYLFDEMSARYSRAYARQYLSDGGHFENTGVYALLRRRVPAILACDNGQDGTYQFADLENLVRKVRLDLGGEMRAVGGGELTEILGSLPDREEALPRTVVDPEATPDWKAEFRKPECRACAVLFSVDFAGSNPSRSLVLWLKPRLVAGMPADIAGYASRNPAFPQQSTGEQFFDEAQWESYRRIGQALMEQVLRSCPNLLCLLSR